MHFTVHLADTSTHTYPDQAIPSINSDGSLHIHDRDTTGHTPIAAYMPGHWAYYMPALNTADEPDD